MEDSRGYGGQMQEKDARAAVNQMSFEDMKRIRDAANRKMKYLRSKRLSLRVQVYIPNGKRQDFEMAKKWAIDNKLVGNDKNYTFLEMCILNAIDAMAKQARQDGITVVMKAQKIDQMRSTEKPQDDLAGTNTRTPQE